MSMPSNQAALTAFVSVFSKFGCSDYYYAYNKQRYCYCDAAVTDAVIAGHVNNTQAIAIVPFSGSETRLAAFDVDNHGGDASWSEVVKLTKPLVNALREEGLRPFVVRSGGGSGIHIWLIWEQLQNAAHVRSFQKKVLMKVGLRSGTAGIVDGTVEIYPKQDEVKEGKKGNCIALPFARQSVPLDADFQPVALDRYQPPNMADLYSPPLPPYAGAEKSQSNPLEPPIDGSDQQQQMPNDLEEVAAALKHIPAEDHDEWIRVGLALKHAFSEDGFAVWDEWSASCPEKYPGGEECRKRWDDLEPTGDVGLGTVFHRAQQHGWNGPNRSDDPVITEMNARFGILTQGKQTEIIDKQATRETDQLWVTLSKGSFRDRLKAEPLVSEDGERPGSKAEYWLSHPKAAHYQEAIFDPSLPPGDNGQQWNAWTGFAFKPVPGNWSLLKDHIKYNICSGQERLFNWLMNWMALGLQKPASVIGPAPVLIGLPGTGKGFLANAYGKLWGRHSIEITNPAHVSGRFNAFLFGRRFVFIDEGTFSGDRAKAGVIKTRITEPRIVFEQKGVDPKPMPNRMIFIVASNDQAAVTADVRDRRWMAIGAGDDKREDHAYFAAIDKQLREGGYQAMMHELLERDISKGPDPRRIIRTQALFNQILHSLGPEARYMHQVLDEGRLPQSEHNLPGVTTSKALHKDLKATQPQGRWSTPESLGRFISSEFNGLVMKRPNGNYVVSARGGELQTERSTEYAFAPLSDCRKRFESYVGQKVEWSDATDEWLDESQIS